MLAAYLVARFLRRLCALLWGVIHAVLPELGMMCLSLCCVWHSASRRFASWLGKGRRKT